MNFIIYVFSTLLMGLVVGFALSLQGAEPPTEFEKYSSATMDYGTMSEAGYAMAAYGRKSAAEYYQLEGYQDYEQKAAVEKTAKRVDSEAAVKPSKRPSDATESPTIQLAANSDRQATSTVAKPTKKPGHAPWPKTIVGIQQDIELNKVDLLWEKFGSDSTLSNQLDSYTISVFAVYSNFNSDYSRATVSMGYDKASMKGTRYPIPTGKADTLLKPSNYRNKDLINAWQNIDYNRVVNAVVERRDYTRDSELTSLFVIYQ